MELIYTDQAMQKQGVIRDFALDMAFGDSENDFQLTMPTPQSKRMGIDRDAIVETRSGTGSIEIQEANGSILQGLSVDGKSEQVRYSGKNMLGGKAQVNSHENQGLKSEYIGNGWFHVYGKSTATSASAAPVFFGTTTQTGTAYVTMEAGKTYVVSVEVDGIVGGDLGTCRIQFATNSGSFTEQYFNESYGFAPREIKPKTTTTNMRFCVFRGSTAGAVSVDFKVRPMLQEATLATANLEYEPYVGGIPSPNPDYPQPVQVVEGRNLFDGQLVNGTFDATTGGLYESTTRVRSSNFTAVNPGTYTISVKSGLGLVLYVYNADKSFSPADSQVNWQGNTYTFTVSKKMLVKFGVRKPDNSTITVSDVEWAQLERGSVATSRVAYDALELVVNSKNLFDSSFCTDRTSNGIETRRNPDGSITFRGTASSQVRFFNSQDIARITLAPGTYTASDKLRIYWSASTSDYSIGTFTIGSEKRIFNAGFTMSSGTEYDTVFYPQIERGSVATKYAPYTETRTTLDLQGHRLASLPDGTNDELTVNAAGRVQLINRVGVVDLGTLTYDYHATYKTFPCYNFSLQNMADGTPNMYCSMYIGATWASAATDATKNGTICSLPSATQIRIRNTAYTDKAVFKAAMSGVMLYYELATPQTYDLGTIELPQTLNGYTRITLDATIDAPFSVEYEAAPASKSYTVEVIPHLQSGALVYDFGTDIGGIVDSEVFDSTGDIPVMAYSGRTWHGILDASITRPNSGQGYLTLTGDINAAIGTLISRAGLGSVFEAGQDAGVSVSYQVPRYISVWEALRRLCKAYGMRPSIHRDNGKTIVEAVQKQDYSNGSVSELSMPISFGRDYRPVNHLVVLGQGELAARTVIDLYADASGNISTRQTLFGAYEVAEVYENTNEADAAKLREDGIKKLQELQQFASVDMALPQNERFQIGDTVIAYSTEVGLMAAAEVVKKVVTVGEDGFAITDYELGEPAIKAYR